MKQKNPQKQKQARYLRRKARSRAKISGTKNRPRLVVSRSIKHITAQVIDDTQGKTLAATSDLKVKVTKKESGDRAGKVAKAYLVGKQIAKTVKDQGVTSVVFDRSGHKFHGRVKALADGAREGGLEF